MGGTIRFSAEGMCSVSQKLKEDGNELEVLLGRIENAVTSLPENWEGNAAQGYLQQFESLKPSLMATRQLVETIAEQIDASLSSMQQRDAEIASRLK